MVRWSQLVVAGALVLGCAGCPVGVGDSAFDGAQQALDSLGRDETHLGGGNPLPLPSQDLGSLLAGSPDGHQQAAGDVDARRVGREGPAYRPGPPQCRLVRAELGRGRTCMR